MQNLFKLSKMLLWILLFNCCTEQPQKTDMQTATRQNMDSVTSGNPVVVFVIKGVYINMGKNIFN